MSTGISDLLKRVRPYAPWGVAAICSLLIAADAAHVVTRIWRLRHLPAQAQGGAAALLHSHLDILPLVNGHLFGAPPAPTQAPSDAPEAGPEYQLTGIAALPDPKAGYAILGRKGQPTRLYQTGGALDGSPATLYEVYEDHVILQLAGQLRTLRLPQWAMEREGPRDRARPMLAAGNPAAREALKNETPFQPVTVAQNLFGRFRPVRQNVDGHFGGVRLMPNRMDQQKYGLRPGDVVTGINGTTLDDPAQLDSVLKQDADANSATLNLTVLRDGMEQTVTVKGSY